MAFFNAAGLFVLLGAELLAMILLVVYVGAVVVLFLFVVMMLDIDFDALNGAIRHNLPEGGAVGFALLIELAMVGYFWSFPASTEHAALYAAPAGVTTLPLWGTFCIRVFLLFSDSRNDFAGRDDRRDRADAARPQKCRRQMDRTAGSSHAPTPLSGKVETGKGVS